jgi:D-alanyl-D-alanine carboxypeptidase
MRRWLLAPFVVAVAVAFAVPRVAGHGDVALPAAAPAPTPVAPTGVGDVRGLTPALRRAVALAVAAARADGVDLVVTSGWRSPAHQQRLYDAAVAKYGSPAAARQWVLPPGESAHVRGEAVDVGPPVAASWLQAYGVRFGLCRRYVNEPWHFERLAGAKGSACPPMEPHA